MDPVSYFSSPEIRRHAFERQYHSAISANATVPTNHRDSLVIFYPAMICFKQKHSNGIHTRYSANCRQNEY